MLCETPKKLPNILKRLLLFFDSFNIYYSVSDISLKGLFGFYLGVALFFRNILSGSLVFKPRVFVVVVFVFESLSIDDEDE